MRAWSLALVFGVVLAGCRRDAQERPQQRAAPTASVAPVASSALDGMGLPDGARARISTLLDGASRALEGKAPPQTDAAYDYLMQTIHERDGRVTFGKSFEEMTKDLQRLTDDRSWRVAGEAYLRAAAAALLDAKPNMSAYDAKKAVLIAFRATYPGATSRAMRFSREPGVPFPEGTPRCDTSAPAMRIATERFYDDPVYRAILKTPPAEITGTAVTAILPFAAIGIDPRVFDGAPNAPDPPREITALVVACGNRCAPCVVELMGDLSAAVVRTGKVPTHDGTGPERGLSNALRDIAAGLPVNTSTWIQRMALAAGWREWLERMPKTAEHDEVRAEFDTRDDPYREN